jgi:hypothetical protein
MRAAPGRTPAKQDPGPSHVPEKHCFRHYNNRKHDIPGGTRGSASQAYPYNPHMGAAQPHIATHVSQNTIAGADKLSTHTAHAIGAPAYHVHLR